MHVKPGYDRHQGLLRVPAVAIRANHLAPSRRRPGSCHLCAMTSGVGPLGRSGADGRSVVSHPALGTMSARIDGSADRRARAWLALDGLSLGDAFGVVLRLRRGAAGA
jgi:hypothetical protein